ncbi:hypothetical protein ACTFIR_006189 [Dictyostelium discoideum]
MLDNNNKNLYHYYYSFYNIKKLFFDFLNYNQEFSIINLSDITELHYNFIKSTNIINYNNNNNQNEIIINFISNENAIKKVLIDRLPSKFSDLNIVFGLFLHENGFNIKLVKSFKNNNKKNYIHYSNILKWVDGKEYLLDTKIGLMFNCFNPLEITNNNNNNNKLFHNRIRKINSNTYSYDEIINNKNNTFITIYHFSNRRVIINNKIFSKL